MSCDGRLIIGGSPPQESTAKLKELSVLDSAGQQAAVKVLDAWLAAEETLVLTVPEKTPSAWQDRAQGVQVRRVSQRPGHGSN